MSITSFKDQTIFVIGGRDILDPSKKYGSVEAYSIKSDSWRITSEINKPRSEFSSCSLGDFIYISCGNMGSLSESKLGIERLDAQAMLSGAQV